MGKRVLSLAVLAALLAWCGYYVYKNASEFHALASVPVSHLGLLTTLAIAMLYVNGVYLRVVVREFGVVLTETETMGISVLSSLANYVMPFRGGVGIRAVYLKRQHGLAYTHFAGITMGSYVAVLFVIGATGMGALGLVYLQEGLYSLPVLLAFGLLLASMTALSVLPVPLPRGAQSRVVRTLVEIGDGWERLKRNGRLLAKILLLTLLNLALGAAMLHVEFRAIAVETTYVKCLLYACAGTLGQLLGITPNALGVREAVLILVGQILLATPEQVLMVSIIDRLVVLVCTLMLSLYFSPALLRPLGLTLFIAPRDTQGVAERGKQVSGRIGGRSND